MGKQTGKLQQLRPRPLKAVCSIPPLVKPLLEVRPNALQDLIQHILFAVDVSQQHVTSYFPGFFGFEGLFDGSEFEERLRELVKKQFHLLLESMLDSLAAGVDRRPVAVLDL